MYTTKSIAEIMVETCTKDVFIAYNLGASVDSSDSSYRLAQEVEKILTQHGYTCFLRDPLDHSKSFDNTERIASQCKCFLFVVNNGVLKKCEKITFGTGESILTLREDAWSYAEIRGFIKQYKFKASLARGHIQCFCKDSSLSDDDIGNLHDAFVNMVPLRSLNSVLEWVKIQLGDKSKKVSKVTANTATVKQAATQQKESEYQKNLRLANQGDAQAQAFMGYYYFYGKEVKLDYAKAADWFAKSASKGNAYSQYQLGVCYFNGKGVARDYQKAIDYFTVSANQNFNFAKKALASCYYLGDGVKQDYGKALEWYLRCEDENEALIQYRIGDCYTQHILGVAPDYPKAVEWLTKAAKQGKLEAQYALAHCYFYNYGNDYAKSAYWYQKAAEQGDAESQFMLALQYGSGKGVEKSYKKAEYWCAKAAAQNHGDAISFLSILRR